MKAQRTDANGRAAQFREDVNCLNGPIHTWFELSYAHYLTVPRSVLQSMPVEWQERFTVCLDELDNALPWRPATGRYWVTLRDGKGRIARDPLNDYRHARRWTADALRELNSAAVHER